MTLVLVLYTNGRYEEKRMKCLDNYWDELGGYAQVVSHAADIETQQMPYTPLALVNENAAREARHYNQWSKALDEWGFVLSSRGLLGNVILCQRDSVNECFCEASQTQRDAVRLHYNQYFHYEPVDAEEETTGSH